MRLGEKNPACITKQLAARLFVILELQTAVQRRLKFVAQGYNSWQVNKVTKRQTERKRNCTETQLPGEPEHLMNPFGGAGGEVCQLRHYFILAGQDVKSLREQQQANSKRAPNKTNPNCC